MDAQTEMTWTRTMMIRAEGCSSQAIETIACRHVYSHLNCYSHAVGSDSVSMLVANESDALRCAKDGPTFMPFLFL